MGGLAAAHTRPGTGIRAAAIAAAFAVLACLAAAVPAAFGDTGTLAVTATVLSKSICMFDTKTATLDFGVLDTAVVSERDSSSRS